MDATTWNELPPRDKKQTLLDLGRTDLSEAEIDELSVHLFANLPAGIRLALEDQGKSDDEMDSEQVDDPDEEDSDEDDDATDEAETESTT